MRTCARCRRELPLESFGIANRERGSRNYSCKECVREYGRRHYAENKAKYLEKARRWEGGMQAMIAAAKARPCADCGGKFPACAMDFDHLPGSAKAFNMAAAKKIGVAKVRAEIAKCEVVCANCHRIRTWGRLRAA